MEYTSFLGYDAAYVEVSAFRRKPYFLGYLAARGSKLLRNFSVYISIDFDFYVTVHHDKFLTIKPTRCTNFSNLFLE